MSTPAEQGRYGKSVVLASFLAIYVLFAFRSVFAILKGYMQAEMGWTGAQTSLGFSIMMSVYAVAAFISGLLLDKFGTKVTFLVAAIFGGLGFAVTGTAYSIPLYFFAYGILGGICCGMLWVSSTVSVRKWYIGDQYAKMFGFAFAGGPMGQLILTFIINNYLSSNTAPDAWRACAYALGAMTFILMVIAVLFAKKGPDAYGMQPMGKVVASSGSGAAAAQTEYVWDLKEAFSSWPLWAGILCLGFSMVAEFLIWSQIVSYWTQDLGIARSDAAHLYMVIGFCGIFTMPILGAVADRVVKGVGNEPKGRKIMLALAPLMGLLGIIALFAHGASPQSFHIGVLACVLFAIYWAVVPGGTVGYVGSIYGRKTLGKIWGLATLIVMGTGPFIGSFLGGYLKDATGTYSASLMLAGGAFFLSSMMACTMPLSVKTPDKSAKGNA